MMRFLCMLIAALSLLALWGCSDSSEALPAETVPTTVATEEIRIEETYTEATTVPTASPETTAPTLPPHSELYIPGVHVEEVILYFNEVCLNAEFINSGDPTRLQKWDDPIFYRINGKYTEEDYAVLTAFTASLNEIYGFPGIYESPDSMLTNFSMYFDDPQSMVALMGEQFRGMDGAVTFWYNDEDVIYNAMICYRTDLDQYLRNSVILEEIYNGLGPIQDTDLRADSIIYSEFSEPQQLSDIDWLILKLLYHPDMKCGMDADQCEAVIRELYY